jgi:hypothetical protein
MRNSKNELPSLADIVAAITSMPIRVPRPGLAGQFADVKCLDESERLTCSRNVLGIAICCERSHCLNEIWIAQVYRLILRQITTRGLRKWLCSRSSSSFRVICGRNSPSSEARSGSREFFSSDPRWKSLLHQLESRTSIIPWNLWHLVDRIPGSDKSINHYKWYFLCFQSFCSERNRDTARCQFRRISLCLLWLFTIYVGIHSV